MDSKRKILSFTKKKSLINYINCSILHPHWYPMLKKTFYIECIEKKLSILIFVSFNIRKKELINKISKYCQNILEF